MIKKLMIVVLLIFSTLSFSSSYHENSIDQQKYLAVKIINSKAQNRLDQLKSKSLLEYDKLIEHYNYLTNSTKKSTSSLNERYPDFELHKKRYDYLVKTIPIIKKENVNTKKEIVNLNQENKHLQSVLKKLISYANSEMDHYQLSVGDAETFDVDHTQKFYATRYSKGEYIPDRLYIKNSTFRVKIDRILLNGEYLSEVQK